jgi:hypothetical protein
LAEIVVPKHCKACGRETPHRVRDLGFLRGLLATALTLVLFFPLILVLALTRTSLEKVFVEAAFIVPHFLARSECETCGRARRFRL